MDLCNKSSEMVCDTGDATKSSVGCEVVLIQCDVTAREPSCRGAQASMVRLV